MTDKEIAYFIDRVLKTKELTEKQRHALELAYSTFHPNCGNCAYHMNTENFYKGRKEILGYKCANPSSPHRRSFTKDSVVCSEWHREDSEENLNYIKFK